MPLHIIRTEPLSPKENMEIDETLLHDLEADPQPKIHFYNWSGIPATYGYFMDPSLYLKEGSDLSLGRRPTGGGMIFHHCDLAFAVLIPASHPGYSVNTLKNYAYINQAVLEAIQEFCGDSPLFFQKECKKGECSQFCMAKPTIYDVMIEGKKVGGGAQRRTKHGLLHQGTIALTLPTREFLVEHLIDGEILYRQMQENSLSLLQKSVTRAQFSEASNSLQNMLIKSLEKLEYTP